MEKDELIQKLCKYLRLWVQSEHHCCFTSNHKNPKIMYKRKRSLTIFSRTVLWNICSLISASSSIFIYLSASSVTCEITRETTFCFKNKFTNIIVNYYEKIVKFSSFINLSQKHTYTDIGKDFFQPPTINQQPSMYVLWRTACFQFSDIATNIWKLYTFALLGVQDA